MKKVFNLHTKTFGTSDVLGITTPVYDASILPKKIEQPKTIKGIDILGIYNGREVFMPVSFYLNGNLFLETPCSTVRLTSAKTIIRTAVSERQGTIKELFNVGDYIITIKGVLIGQYGLFPDELIQKVKELYETTEPVELYCAFTELFQSGSRRVVIESIEFPEVQGGARHLKPFILNCETDYIDNLILA